MRRTVTKVIVGAPLLGLLAPAAQASAASMTHPASAKPGQQIHVVGKQLKAARYSLSITATDTSGKVCVGTLGRPKTVRRDGGRAVFDPKVPRRIPCFGGARGNGPRVGSRRLTPGTYFLVIGKRTGHAFWTKKASTVFDEIKIR